MMLLVLVLSFTMPPDLRPVQQALFVGSDKVAAINLYVEEEKAKAMGGRCSGELYEMRLEELRLIKMKIPEVIIG
jgi:hypothetical protein